MKPQKVSVSDTADIFRILFRPALKRVNSAIASNRRFFFTRQPKNRFYPKMSGYASKETLYGMIKFPKQIVSPSWPLNSLWAGNQGNTPPTA